MNKKNYPEGGFMDQWFRDAIDKKCKKELENWDKKEKEYDKKHYK